MLRIRKNSRSHRQSPRPAEGGGRFRLCRCQSRRLPRRQAIVGNCSPTPNDAAAVPRRYNQARWPSAAAGYPRSTMRRTGRLLTLSMPVSSSTFPARPPQPSCRMRSMMSRISISPCTKYCLADQPLLAAAAIRSAGTTTGRRQRLVEGFRARRQRVVAVAAPVPSGDRSGRHQEPGGRIMRAKNALISGEASVLSSAASRRICPACWRR